MTFGFEETPEEKLLKATLALPAEQREAFMRQGAGGDEELYQNAKMLLQGYEEAGGDEAASVTAGISARKRWAKSTDDAGSTIGIFTLVRKIGEGGMGSVWEAEQKGSIVRRVALKLIKLGMDTEEVVRRFERERQTLAVLEHPNIAQVFEAGATELGRPYFAMEFVEGEPITDFVASKALGVEEKLRLLIAVCSGLEHAHRKGIIHRDLKPTNILVSAESVPKIIDFGIAKAATEEGDMEFTRASQMLGTPAYMSPEQAGGGVAAIDTRSDVYSLGVVLYELLAGAPPFDPDRLASTGVAELQKIIAEEEPPRPSTRRKVAAGAPSSVDLPSPNFDRDLDWIVMTAMAKEPERRYQSAAALREDLQRYLDGEVVSAVPPSFGYRLGKFAKRHRSSLLAAAAALVALSAGILLRGLFSGEEGIDPMGVVTPMSVRCNVETEGDPQRLIDGSGLDSVPTGENLQHVSHDFSLAENSWVTLRHRPDYFDAAEDTPVLEFELAEDTEITGFAYWGYLLIRFGPSFGHEPKLFRFTFRDAKGKALGEPVERVTAVPTRRAARVIPLPRTAGVRRISVEVLDNHYPFSGGDRVAMGEVRFLSSDAPPQAFDSIDEWSPLPPLFAARLVPTEDRSGDIVIGHTPGVDFVAGDPPDHADTAMKIDGQALSQFRGVLIPSAALRPGDPIILRAAGELNDAPEVAFDPPFPPGIWLSSNRASNNFESTDTEAAIAYFPFAAGWAGGHFDKGLRPLHSKNAARDFEIERLGSGRISVRDPAGECTPTAGALFAVSTGNLSQPEVATTRVRGDSWELNLTTGANGEPVDISWSFVYLPFETKGVAVGMSTPEGRPSPVVAACLSRPSGSPSPGATG